METSRTIRAILWMSVAMCFCCVSSRAQLPTATLNGTVTDPQGAVIAGARVAATSQATGLSRETTTGAEGFYTITNLVPGAYNVRADAKGFASREFKNVLLEVGRTQTLDLSLALAAVGQQVAVSVVPIQVELTQFVA
jgi:Carboxypeptidase regulatory-like domain